MNASVDRRALLPFFAVSVSAPKLSVFLIYCAALLALLPVAARHLVTPDFLPSLCLAFALGLLIPGVLVFKRRIDLIEPINWFSLMYWLVFPGAVYFLVKGFDASDHYLPITQPRLTRAVTIAMSMFFAGYASFVAGYAMFARDVRPRDLRLPTKEEFSPLFARAAVVVCVAAGLLNFLYLLVSYPRGIIGYMIDFGVRSHRYELIGTVTTVGYQFLYAGVNLWFLVLLRENRLSLRITEAWLFVAVAAMSVGISISEGHMSATVTYILGLGFLVYVTSAGHAKNLRYAALVAVGMVFGIVLYLLRRASSAAYTGAANFAVTGLVPFAERFVGDLGYWIIGKGNIPNVPVVVNLVDQSGIEGHLLYGQSFFMWLTGLSSEFGHAPNIGQQLGLLWKGMEGGLPPTIVGEMYVNFGWLGVPVGLCFAGMVCSWGYQAVRTRGEFIWYVVYLAVLLKFVFIWPKGEFSNLVSATWTFLPTVVVYACIRAASASRRPAGTHAVD